MRYYAAMGKQDKDTTAMRNNPRDWRIEQLESVAAHAGLKVRKWWKPCRDST